MNVNPPVEPLQVVFGAGLSNVDNEVTTGKNNSRRLRALGIVLLPAQSEEIEWHAKMPVVGGNYSLWIDLIANDGLSGRTSYRFTLKVHKFRRIGS